MFSSTAAIVLSTTDTSINPIVWKLWSLNQPSVFVTGETRNLPIQTGTVRRSVLAFLDPSWR